VALSRVRRQYPTLRAEELPWPDRQYRCHVCRLELSFDLAEEKLVVTPMHGDEPDQKIRKTA
jgi:hypothetical protein